MLLSRLVKLVDSDTDLIRQFVSSSGLSPSLPAAASVAVGKILSGLFFPF